MSLQFSYVKFPQDSIIQKLLKSIRFSPSYSKYKKGWAFSRHSVSGHALQSSFIRRLANRRTTYNLSKHVLSNNSFRYPIELPTELPTGTEILIWLQFEFGLY